MFITEVVQSILIRLVPLFHDEGDADYNGDCAYCADDVDCLAVSEDADEEAHDYGGEGKSSDDSHVFGEDEGTDVAQLSDCHGNS